MKRGERRAGAAHRHPGEPGGVYRQAAEIVEQARLAPRLGAVARDRAQRIGLRHEQILDRVLVAAGAAQPHRVPDIGELGLGFGEQAGAHRRAAVAFAPRLAVRLDHRHMAAEPARVVAAAGKGPGRRHVIAAGDGARLARTRPPGEDAARAAENVLRHLGRKIGRGHRAAGILVEAPGKAGVDPGERLDDRHVLRRQQLGPAERARQ